MQRPPRRRWRASSRRPCSCAPGPSSARSAPCWPWPRFFHVLVGAGWTPGDATGSGTALHQASLRSIGPWTKPLLLWGVAFEPALTALLGVRPAAAGPARHRGPDAGEAARRWRRSRSSPGVPHQLRQWALRRRAAAPAAPAAGCARPCRAGARPAHGDAGRAPVGQEVRTAGLAGRGGRPAGKARGDLALAAERTAPAGFRAQLMQVRGHRAGAALELRAGGRAEVGRVGACSRGPLLNACGLGRRDFCRAPTNSPP